MTEGERKNQRQEDFKDVKPVVRSVVALAIFLRRNTGIKDAYDHADKFIATLEEDL